MANYLLLGAGFSRNWGGWLASEAFEYLLGKRQLDSATRELLWRVKATGGFERALSELEDLATQLGKPEHKKRLEEFNGAVREMFADMDSGFSKIQKFDFTQNVESSLIAFLATFDAIFTLNQDLLLERFYLHQVPTVAPGRWNGAQIPGVIAQGRGELYGSGHYTAVQTPVTDVTKISLAKRTQLFIKLHGSWNWRTPESENILVIGGNKSSSIGSRAILKWNYDRFLTSLSAADSRLLVIGYSFGDEHINDAIVKGVEQGRLRIFVIDPAGVDVMNRNGSGIIPATTDLAKQLWPSLAGASRRNLRETFGGDSVEYAKVMRFIV